jgi:hypothetical protein
VKIRRAANRENPERIARRIRHSERRLHHKVRLAFSPTEPDAGNRVIRVSAVLKISTDDPAHASIAMKLFGKLK